MSEMPELLGAWSCDFPLPAPPRGDWEGAAPRSPWDGRELYDDFMCVCQPGGRAECDAMRAWAKSVLHTDDAGFLSAAVYAMSSYFDASITGMPSDQWARVEMVGQPSGQGWELRCEVDCDRLEDGLACCLRAFCERFPESARELLEP